MLLLSRQSVRAAGRLACSSARQHMVPKRAQLAQRARVQGVVRQAAAKEDASGASTSGALTEDQARQVWDSVSRALLRLGGSGATPTHIRSLQELVAAHTLVKVQLNGKWEDAAVQEAAQQLAEGSGASVVQVKGRTIMFAAAGQTPADILRLSKQLSAKTAAWRAKKAAVEEKKREAVAATETKRAANTSRSGKRRASADTIIGDATAAARGPLTKRGLQQEWAAISEGLVAEEGGPRGAAAPGRRRSSSQQPKQPWKRGEGEGGDGNSGSRRRSSGGRRRLFSSSDDS